MTVLSVNLNKVALLRNSRDTTIPSVVAAARTVIAAGAQGITVHPRPDQRHIRPSDVRDLKLLLSTEYPQIEFNIEGNPYAEEEQDYPGFIELVKEAVPNQCTLVPDDPNQLTSDHGWNLRGESNRLKQIVEELHSLGTRISLFMDPDPEQIELAKRLGVDRIELYTGPYADAFGTTEEDAVFAKFHEAAEKARAVGLGLNAGHDLNQQNLAKFCQVANLAEVSIGHAIICDALWAGLEQTVSAYRAILDSVS